MKTKSVVSRAVSTVLFTVMLSFCLIISAGLAPVYAGDVEPYNLDPIENTDISPSSLAVDINNNLYVTEIANRFMIFTGLNYAPVLTVGTTGTGDSQFYTPRGIAVDKDGNIFVADTENHRIQKFNSSGEYISQWGGGGSGNSQFYTPYGIAADKDGNIFVADSGNRRIQKFSGSGSYITQWGEAGSNNSQFDSPVALAVDSNGNIFVADSGNNRIQKFDSSGTYISQWGETGSSNGQFNSPVGVAVDSNGNVFVADYSNYRIQKFDNNGMYLYQYQWNVSDTLAPFSVAVDSLGSVYVAESTVSGSSRRIQKLTLDVGVPGAPSDVTAVAVGAGSQATVSFTPSTNNGGSPVVFYTVTSSPGNITATGTASPITVPGLNNGTLYTFTVAASNAAGKGAVSTVSNSVTPNEASIAPTNVTVTAGKLQATVSFIAMAVTNSDIINYTVTSNPAGGVDSNAGTTNTSHLITGLNAGTAYTFTVTASNAVGSVTSVSSNSIIPYTVPGAPTAVTATASATRNQATVSFTAPASDGYSPITGYIVTASPGGLTASGSISPLTVTGLTAGTDYTFTVVATNAAGDSAASAASAPITINNSCVPRPLGLLSWFKGEGNATDSWTYANNGTQSTTLVSTTVDENLLATTSCAADRTIQIFAAAYGSNCPTPVTTNNCPSTCVFGGTSCSATFSNIACGSVATPLDPCLGTFKKGTLALACSLPYPQGIVGKAFTFSGNPDRIVQSKSYKAVTLPTANTFTMEFWAKPDAAAIRSGSTQGTGGVTGGSGQFYAIFPEVGDSTLQSIVGAGVSVGANGISVFEHTNGLLYSPLVYNNNLSTTEWNHIAVVYTAGKPALFVNGVDVTPAGVVASGRTVFPSANLGENGQGYGYYKGGLDEVHIFNRALTSTEIGTIHTAGSGSNKQGLCASAPVITGISPASGIATNTVSISGTDFTDATAVKFGTVVATFTVVSDTQITATVPAGTLGSTVDITVTTYAGTSTIGTVDQFSYRNSQTINFGTAPGVVVGNTGTVSATGGASGNSVLYSSTTPAVCSISGSTVTGFSVGSCIIAANQAGTTTYNAATEVKQTITIGQGSQTITFATASDIFINAGGTLHATGGSSINPLVFGTTTDTICSVTGTSFSGLAAGTCTITANQAGDTNYGAALQKIQDIIINRKSQTITFGTAPSVFVGTSGTVSATGGASTNPLVFGTTTDTICSVSGSTVTGKAAGTCTITANQAGDTLYSAAPEVTLNISISIQTFTLTYDNNMGFSSLSSPSYGPGDTVHYGAIAVLDSVHGKFNRPGYVGNSWNTHADGSGTTYSPNGGYFTITESTTLYAQWVSPLEQPSGLVSWWRGEGSVLDVMSGLTSSVSGLTGSLVGLSYSNAGSIYSKVGASFLFSGQTYTEKGPTYEGKVSSSDSSSFTMDFWARPYSSISNELGYLEMPPLPTDPSTTFDATSTEGLPFAIYPQPRNSATEANAGISVGKDAIILFERGSNSFAGATPLVYQLSSGDLDSDGWMHIALIYENQIPKLYVNGSLKKTGLSTGRTVYPSSSFGGTIYDNIAVTGGTYFSGFLDEVHIFNRALALSEIQGIYNAGAAGLKLMAAPVISTVTPSTGPANGGTPVTITGSDFYKDAATQVNFGSTPASSFTADSNTRITAIAPAHAGGVADITVVTTSGTSASSSGTLFTYTKLPQTITFGTAPTVLVGGTGTVSATGGGSSSVLAYSTTTTDICSVSGNVVTGIMAGTCNVDVNQAGDSTYNAAPKNTQLVVINQPPPPTVTSISPANGPLGGGTTVTITGTNLNGATVMFGSTSAAIVSNSGILIEATAPAGSGTVDITVTTLGGTSAISVADQFTYVPYYNVTSSVNGSNGKISCSSPVREGLNSLCTITPDAGYQLATLTDNGADVISWVSPDGYTISGLNSDHTIVAGFALTNYRVAFIVISTLPAPAPVVTAPAKIAAKTVYSDAVSSIGSLIGSPLQTIIPGGSTTPVTAVPMAGYHFLHWEIRSNTKDRTTTTIATNPVTITNVTADVVVYAVFEPDIPMIKLPQTGQNSCFSAAGDSASCSGTGQDGELKKGVAWPDPRFIDNNNNTVTDLLTGLMWNHFGSSSSWQDALAMLPDLNANGYNGYSDWRLPNIIELMSLTDLSKKSPALPDGSFSGVQLNKYWSSTYRYGTTTLADIGDVSSAWVVNMLDGAVESATVNDSNFIWLVRDSGQAGTILLPVTGQNDCIDATGSFAVSCKGTGQDGVLQKGVDIPIFDDRIDISADFSAGIINDTTTGLVWMIGAVVDETCFGLKTWQESLDAVKTLMGNNSKCGLNDGSKIGEWRLPNRAEMLTLIDFSDQSTSSVRADFWTADTFIPDPAQKWTFSMNMARVSHRNAAETGYLFPVRDYRATISVAPSTKDFGNVASGSQTFTLVNTGIDPLPVNSIAINGGDSSMFTLTSGDGSGSSCGLTPVIRPGASCTVEVAFTRSGAAAINPATLVITSGDFASRIKNIVLSASDTPVYNITTTVDGVGTVTCDTPVTQGSDGTCSIKAATGHHLVSLTDNNSNKLAALSSSSYTVTGVTGNHTIAATFAIDSYTISFANSANGSLVGATSQTVNYGSDATVVTAVPAPGYEFVSWNGITNATANPLTLTNVSASKTITANFLPRADSWVSKVPRTGQTTCYEAAGAVTDCAGTGQDGELKKGVAWPVPRLTDNQDGTVTDHLTGLIWLKNPLCNLDMTAEQSFTDLLTKTGTLASGLASGACGLIDGSHAGDWRVPNIVELQSLVNLSQQNPALPAGNPFSISALFHKIHFLTSTSKADSAYEVRSVGFGDGLSSRSGKVRVDAVWAVRGGQGGAIQLPRTGQTGCWDDNAKPVSCAASGQDGDKLQGVAWPDPRFTSNPNGTVTDNLTRLVWLGDGACLGTHPWSDALTTANTLVGDNSLCSLNDGSAAGSWRLPNRNELSSLINYQEVDSAVWLNLPAQKFTAIQPQYWTSDSKASSSIIESKGYVNFVRGIYDTDISTSNNSVLPVRDYSATATITPASPDFGQLGIGIASAPKTVTITNNGIDPLQIYSVDIIGTDSSMFALDTTTLSMLLDPKNITPLSITFTPNSGGAKSAILRISSNDPTSPITDVHLNGNGPDTLAQSIDAITLSPANLVYGAGPATLYATASSGLPVTFSIVSGAATISSGNQLTISTGTGNVVVRATQAGNSAYSPTSLDRQIVLHRAATTITWPNPAAIVASTALSATQLNATASVPGSFVYTPADGAVLAAGLQTLSVTFTPTETNNYYPKTATVVLTVTPVNSADTVPPTVDSFSIPATATSATVAITLADSDNIGVTTWILCESENSCQSYGAKPTSYTFGSMPQGVATTKTLTAKVQDAAGNVSVAKTTSVVITLPDTTKPFLSSFTLPNTATTLTVAVTLAAQDNVGVTGYLLSEFGSTPALNAAAWTATKPVSHTFASAGAKTLYASVKDAAGNIAGPFSTTVSITLPDTTAPVVNTFTIPATSTSLTVDISSFTASDSVGVTGYLVSTLSVQPAANSTFWTSSAPTQHVFASQGVTTLYAFAKDGSGNISAPLTASVTISLADKTAPTVDTFVIPATETSLTVGITTLTASDNTAVTAVTAWLLSEQPTVAADSPVWSATKPTTHIFASQGVKTLYAFAKDAAGNISVPASATVTITLADSTAPSVTSFTIPATAASLTVTGFTIAASDNTGVTGYFLSESGAQPAADATGWTDTPPTGYNFTSQGDKTLYAFAKDAGGNISVPYSASVFIALADATPPTVNTFALPATSTNLTVAVTSFIASDTAGVTGYLISESAAASASDSRWTATPTSSYTFVTAGAKTLHAFAKDAAGNISASATATVTITLADTTAPMVGEFTMPSTEANLTVGVTEFTASDAIGVTGYILTESSTKPEVAATGWSSTAPGSHTVGSAGAKTIYAYAKDAAGNVSAAAIRNITITLADTTAPEVTGFIIPSTGPSLTVAITNFTASDTTGVSGYIITENSTTPDAAAGGWSSTAPVSYTFGSEGTKTLYAYAKDAAGNVSAPATQGITITLPAATSYTAVANVYSGSSITPAFQAITPGASATFTVIPTEGYGILSVTGCGGTLTGTTYTTAATTGNCNITVTALTRNGRSADGVAPTIGDALKALKSYVGVATLTNEEKIRYDVAPLSSGNIPQGNGSVDFADVIMILRRSIGIGNW